MELFIWSTFYLCVVFTVSLMVGVRRNSMWVKVLTLPGLLLYSACRVLGCLASCTPMEKFGVLEDGEPFVKVGTTRMAYVGHFLGVVVTHAALVVCLFCAQGLTGIESWEAFYLPAFSTIVTSPPEFVDYLGGVKDALPLGAAGFWVTLYLCAAACFNFELSMRDFLAGICVTITGAWVCAVLAWLGVHASFLSNGWLIVNFRVPTWLGVASFYLLAVWATGLVVAATLGWKYASRSYKRQAEKTEPSRSSHREREKQTA